MKLKLKIKHSDCIKNVEGKDVPEFIESGIDKETNCIYYKCDGCGERIFVEHELLG